MYLFFVKPDQIQGNMALITGQDAVHIKQVLRMKPKDMVRISDGREACWFSRIEDISSGQIRVELLKEDTNGTELSAEIILIQGLPKGDKMELIIQKNVELGITRILPVITKRTVVKWDVKKSETKVNRWNTIARSAAEQSKRTKIPVIEPVTGLKEAIAWAGDFDIKLIPYENAQGIEATREYIKSIRPGSRVAFIIGPEGGFEEAEVELAKNAGFHPVTLGKRILRTETAGMALMSLIMFQLEE